MCPSSTLTFNKPSTKKFIAGHAHKKAPREFLHRRNVFGIDLWDRSIQVVVAQVPEQISI